jgi:hypothetical protein
MKTKFITSVMAMIFASASLFAADPAATFELVNQKGSSIYKVVYKAPGSGKVFLKISGTDGLVLSETLSFTNGFTLPIDFKGMAEGEYIVEVVGKGTNFKQTVTLKSNKPVAYVRLSEQPNKKKLLTITSEVPSDFTIRVFDKWNNEVFTKVESVNTSYGVLLNVSGLASGYSIEVTETIGNVKVIRK